jgi:hypothetical protein
MVTFSALMVSASSVLMRRMIAGKVGFEAATPARAAAPNWLGAFDEGRGADDGKIRREGDDLGGFDIVDHVTDHPGTAAEQVTRRGLAAQGVRRELQLPIDGHLRRCLKV